MKFFLDTANFDEIKKWSPFIEGVTTNPLHLKNEKMEWFRWLDEFSEFHSKNNLDSNFTVFIQVLDKPNHELIKNPLNFNIVWKISMNYGGYSLSKQLKNNDFSVCSTTVYDLAQLNFALENNFNYSMVYFHKNEDKRFISDAIEYKEQFHFDKDTRLIAASFRTKEEIINIMKTGIEYATVRPEHLEMFYINRQSREDYKELYGE